MIRIMLLLCSLSFGVTRTHQDLVNLAGRKGDITHLYDLYQRTGCAAVGEYVSLSAALAAAPSCLAVTDTITLTANTTFTVPMVFHPGGYLRGAYTPTFNAPFEAGAFKVFDSTLSDPVFGAGSVKYVLPEWWGAAGDLVTDDYRALTKALGSSTLYGGPRVLLTSVAGYGFSSRLRIATPVVGNGTVLKMIGSGANFKIANNPGPDEGTIPILDCGILIVDGGSLSGLHVRAGTSVDTNGNEGIWMVCMQAAYGNAGLTNVRIIGQEPHKRLNGLIVRYCTTAMISNIGIIFVTDGFKVDATNISQFTGIFAQNTNGLGKPFYFTNSSHNMVNSLWTEQCDSTSTAFLFDGVNNYQVHGLKIGEVVTGTKMYAGVWLKDCEKMQVSGLSVEPGATWTKARTWITGTSKNNLLDLDVEPVGSASSNSGYGLYSMIDFQNTKRGEIDSVSLATTAQRRYIGRINRGARLNVTMVARSAGITTPALAVHRLASGGYTSLGTLTYSTLTNKGDEGTQGIDVTDTGPYYLTASAGTGDVDLEHEFSRASGAALVTP